MALEDRRDSLRLLALAARGQGFEGLEEYEPPSVAIARDLAAAGDDKVNPLGRELTVRQFLTETGSG